MEIKHPKYHNTTKDSTDFYVMPWGIVAQWWGSVPSIRKVVSSINTIQHKTTQYKASDEDFFKQNY